MASGGKRKMIKMPVVARATGKPATQAARKGTRKEAAHAKVPAPNPAAAKQKDKVAEHGAMLHEHLAVGASAMAKAIRDAHKPVKPPKRSGR